MEETLSTMETTLSTMATSQQHERRPHSLDSIPEVTALHDDTMSPLEDRLSSSSTSTTSTIPRRERKMQEQADTIRELKHQLQEMQYALAHSTQHQAELHSILQAAIATPGPNSTPGPKEIPGPHRLQPRTARQEDIDFQEKVRQQATTTNTTENLTNEQQGLEFIKQLAKAIHVNNHSDITEPAKFSGQDQHWDEFYSQLRSYFAAKDWLSTFDHPTGPGTADFNMAINLKIYNKLTMLCHKGTAITYIRMAAEFDGWGAGKSLLARYHGFSKQRHRTLRHTIENLRHVNGTNICTHIDLFEKLCTQMAHNDPMNPPTEEQKIDWFLDTVTERTYESVHANCSDANIAGTLTFNKVIKLYTHKCFSRYPQFQLSELVGSAKSPITNNSTTTFVKGDRKQNDNNRGKGKGKPKGNRQNHRSSSSGSQTHDNRNREQGIKKGKGKPNRTEKGNRTKKGPCNYCNKDGHEAATRMSKTHLR